VHRMFPGWCQTKIAIIHGVTLAASCAVSYWLITHILGHPIAVSRDDDFLGGMWATIATLFVYRFSYEQSISAALSRMASTIVSFVLCLVYLLMFPFHLWGLAALIGIGAVTMSLISRPDDIVTNGITTAVVMVVAAISPRQAWIQPVLRLVDTIVGVSVGVVAAWLSLRAARPSVLSKSRTDSAASAGGPGLVSRV
jgi:uncharacterized membrane protein YgaE (UPF0421/DUF939 family)